VDDVYETKALSDVHNKFRNPISLEKGSIEQTPDKHKIMMTGYKKKVMKTIGKYNLGGNGADMAVFEDDLEGKLFFSVHSYLPNFDLPNLWFVTILI
jgi:hypothetical protein